jgi:hypothetical protein
MRGSGFLPALVESCSEVVPRCPPGEVRRRYCHRPHDRLPRVYLVLRELLNQSLHSMEFRQRSNRRKDMPKISATRAYNQGLLRSAICTSAARPASVEPRFLLLRQVAIFPGDAEHRLLVILRRRAQAPTFSGVHYMLGILAAKISAHWCHVKKSVQNIRGRSCVHVRWSTQNKRTSAPAHP